MSYGLTLVTVPAAEPLTTAEAKSHLRVDHTADDTLIAALIVAAREQVETHTGRALVTQTWDLSLDGFPCGDTLALPLPPLQSITSLKYTDSAGAETTWGASNYQVDITRVRGRLVLAYGISWPSVTLRPANGVVVRFVAGYGAAAAVPQTIKQALLLLVGHLYENREAVVGTPGVTINPHTMPLGVDALLATYWAKSF